MANKDLPGYPSVHRPPKLPPIQAPTKPPAPKPVTVGPFGAPYGGSK